MEKEDMQEVLLELIPETWDMVRVYTRHGFPNFDDEHLIGIMSRAEAAAELAGDDDDLPTYPAAVEGEASVNGIMTEGIDIFCGDSYEEKTIGFVFPEQPAAVLAQGQLLLDL